MKSRCLMCFTAFTLFATPALPTELAAQEDPRQRTRPKKLATRQRKGEAT
jgi:hypothetical protein